MSQAVNWLGWFFLPGLVTGFAHTLYYRITIRAGEPHPAQNTPRWQRDRRRIFVAVIVTYLSYTIYEAVWRQSQAGDFYRMLGVGPSANDRTIRSAYNNIARVRHPDKAPAQYQAAAQDFFVQLTRAKDTLLNPTRRFAYERLGEAALTCRSCSSRGDYVWLGAGGILGWYGITAAFMMLLGLLGYAPYGVYWRWMMLAAMLLSDISSLTRPHFTILLGGVINPVLTKLTSHPPLLPFQLTELLRAFLVTVSIAFNQLGPALNSERVAPTASIDDQMGLLERLVQVADAESTALLSVDMAPFVGDEKALNSVKTSLKDWLVEQTIRTDPEVRDAVGRVLARRRQDAPAGARGTR